jgi:hypothetical protein
MKKYILSLTLGLISLFAFTQSSDQLVSIKLKNSSWLPKKCTVVSYTPGDTGNGTVGYWLWPAGTKEITYKEGTKLYLVNQKQVDVVMSGKRIDNEEPFLIVKKEDNDKVFKF